MRAILFFDGAAICNPGHAGAGFVLKDVEGKVLDKGSKYLGKQTNNFAEYTALINGLECAISHGCKDLIVCGDSNLVIQQMVGDFKVKTETLRPLHQEATDLTRNIPTISFYWIPREENVEADEQSRIALEKEMSNGVLNSILKKHKFKK